MKILFVAEYAYPHTGGAEKFIQTLSESLIRKRHHVTIITSRFDSNLPKYEIIHGVEYIRTNTVNIVSPRFSFFFSIFFKLIKHGSKYDVIQNFPYMSSFWVWLYGKLFGKPTVLTVFEIGGKLWTKFTSTNKILYFFFRLYENFIFNLNFNQIVGISRYTYNSLRVFTSHSDQALTYIYPGFDDRQWDPKLYKKKDINKLKQQLGLKGKWVYLFFGRPGVSKGLDVLMKAVKDISKLIPKSHALIITSHQEKYEITRLINLIEYANVGRSVTIMDSIDYEVLPNYIMIADCVVIPSISEGFGYSVVEACTLGKPVVVSDVGSIPEVAFGKVNFFKPQDSSELTKAIKKSFKDEYEDIPSKSFPIENFVKHYLSIYKKLEEKV